MSFQSSFITIIIPVYNAELFLRNCIESIIAQTVDNWYLILVDDGSTDNSGNLCDEYASKNKKITALHQQNSGPGKARNTGIAACCTEWMTFVDADDMLLPNYLENFQVEKCKNAATLSIQGFKRVNMQGQEIGERMTFSNSTFTGSLHIRGAFEKESLYSFGHSIGKLYNKKVCIKNGIQFNTKIRWGEDHLFYLEYLVHINEIQTHSGTLYLYQLAENAETLTHRKLGTIEALNIFHSIEAAASALVEKFKLHDSSVIDSINYHSVTAGFSNVLQSLDKTIARHERILYLDVLQKDMRRLSAKYKANSLKGKVIKYILLYSPSALTEKIL